MRELPTNVVRIIVFIKTSLCILKNVCLTKNEHHENNGSIRSINTIILLFLICRDLKY